MPPCSYITVLQLQCMSHTWSNSSHTPDWNVLCVHATSCPDTGPHTFQYWVQNWSIASLATYLKRPLAIIQSNNRNFAKISKHACTKQLVNSLQACIMIFQKQNFCTVNKLPLAPSTHVPEFGKSSNAQMHAPHQH